MRNRSFAWLTLVCLLAIFLASPNIYGQSSVGSVRGTVQDPTGAVIPNVTVVLTNTATGVQQNARSNESGIYVFPSVNPGPYRIEAESAGMAKFDATVTVQTATSSTIDIALVPAGTATTVQVADVTPVLKTDTPTMSHTLERARIEQLPINGRFVTNLLQTIPGINQDNGIRVFGARSGTHDLILDGAALTDSLYGGAITRPPSLDSIQEFHVEVNNTSARYARQATIIMTTKSGTNEIHGSLFETNRNSGYGVARQRQSTWTKPAKLNRNEFGGTVGGPVWIPKLYDGRNRTFWFFNYEGYKLRSESIGTYRVPTEKMRNGDFSELVNSAGAPVTIYDPLTTDTATGMRQPFTYQGQFNRIDPARLSPFAKYIYGILPLPNVAGVNPLLGANFIAPAPTLDDQYTWGARFDHRFSDKDMVFGRITKSMATRDQPAANGVPTLDGFGNSRTNLNPNKSLAVDWTRTFSPTFYNQVTFSASRRVDSTTSGEPGRKYTDELGLPNPNDTAGYPVVNNIGVGTGVSNYFQPVNWNISYFNYFILENNATKILGKHEFQFGGRFRHDQLNYMPQQQRTAGNLSFVANATALLDPANSSSIAACEANPANCVRRPLQNTGDVGAAFFLGYANYEVRKAKGMYYIRQNEDALYFQDRWRVNNRLTLNLGVRWQFTPYAYDKYNLISGFDPKSMSIVLGQPLDFMYTMGATTPQLINVLQSYGAKFITPEQAGLPKKMVKNNWFDIGPHVGFAYKAFDGPSSFVIRGGYSINYNTIPLYTWNDRMRLNAPFAGFYQNYQLTASDQSPDLTPQWGLVNRPTIVTGLNSANAVTFDRPTGITPGSESFQVAYFNPNQPTARVHDWNLTVEKEVLPDTVLRVAYVGNHGTRQESYLDWNSPTNEYVWVSQTGTVPPSGITSQTALRPNPNQPYGNLQEWQKDGWGWSNGAQVELQRRYSKGFGFQVFYVLMNVTRAAAAGWEVALPPASNFLPGTVPTDNLERLDLLLNRRDPAVPQHEVRWNWIADLPFGKGKAFANTSNRFVNGVLGGWQIAGLGRWRTRWFSLPTTNWPTGEPIKYNGESIPIEDCRSGTCRPGFLAWNAYIPAHQINSTNAQGRPNGVMGVPADYKPTESPLWPYPANYPSLNAQNDPNFANYGTNFVWLPLNNGTQHRINLNGNTYGSPLHPWLNQVMRGNNQWNTDASLIKNFTINERMNLRFTADFFNVFNVPGNPLPNSSGIIETWTSAQEARVMQLSARFAW